MHHSSKRVYGNARHPLSAGRLVLLAAALFCGLPLLAEPLIHPVSIDEKAYRPSSLVILQNLDPAAAIRRGDSALTAKIVTIVEKPRASPTGNAHDYISYAIYFWPNPNTADGMPFVSRDGVRNQAQIALGDAPRFRLLLSEVEALAVAWQLTGKADYARRAGDWLRAWMVAPATRMTPNLQGAQIRLGQANNQGGSGGIIDAARLAQLLEAITLLEGSPALTAADEKAVRAWLGDYYMWLTTSKNGREERKKPNNHGVWYLGQVASLATYLGRTDEAKAFLQEARDRIGQQIDPDGRQPLELKRADGFSYSVYNLNAYFGLALLGERLGIDLLKYEAPNGGSLKKALDYLLPYTGLDRRAWPGNQQRPITSRELDIVLTVADRVWPQESYGKHVSSE